MMIKIIAVGTIKEDYYTGAVKEYSKRLNPYTKLQIVQVPDTTSQLQAVRTGRADAAIGTQLTMKGLAEKAGDQVEATPDFKDDPAHTGYGALAFRPQDKALRDAVNAELKNWLGSDEHLKTVEPFGFDRSNITDKTAEELCSA